MNEQFKYETIKHLVDHPDASKQRASLKLHCTVRHVNRMIAGYLREGKAFFVQGKSKLLMYCAIALDFGKLVRETLSFGQA